MKYSKITGLADDLCLAMQAESVLIDRIPGKSTVGIQIPNPNREIISMRELLEAESTNVGLKADAGAGQDDPRRALHQRPRDDASPADRRSTGTGKSVSVNAMLSSILFRATPTKCG